MPKKKPAPVALSLRAVVPIARGTGATGDAPGWTGNDVAPGDTLTTTDADLHAYLVALGYGRDTTPPVA